ncbi:peroxisomal succinyl-coenzyme A thioesterase-like isoform X2 [Antennarius striatus]
MWSSCLSPWQHGDQHWSLAFSQMATPQTRPARESTVPSGSRIPSYLLLLGEESEAGLQSVCVCRVPELQTGGADHQETTARRCVSTQQMDVNPSCVQLSVLPSRGLVDEKFTVLVQKAPPGLQLTLHALHKCDDGHSWEAFAHYCTSAAGTINVSEDPSLGGTYSGVEQMGLLWSLRPVPGSRPWIGLRKVNAQSPMVFTISVYTGHQTEGFVGLVPLAGVEVERWYVAPGVQRIPVTEDGLSAVLYLPPGPGPFPGVLDLWGGGGKLVEYRAALLASHGFASLALDYLTPKVTLETGKLVGNDYFEKAYRVLQQHPQVLGSRIAMIGLSFGTSMTLKMAAYSEVIKLRCAVCISGSHVQPVDGSISEIMSFLSGKAAKTRVTDDNQVIWRDLLLPIPTDPTLKVDMGRLRCPLLLVVGEDDMNWPSCESAADMKDMMQRAGNSHLLTVLQYPNAGHLIEPPYTPLTRASYFKSATSDKKAIALWGGQTVAHAHAQEDAWRKILVFLRENLYGATDPTL